MDVNLQKKINTDYLQFDAYNMKDSITKFLSEDETFTDQVYEGSNLSVLIDLVAQHFQVLMYYLNHSAAESMFSDSSLYENMNRLVKLLNYSPNGYSTSIVNVSIDSLQADSSNSIIPEYSTIDTGQVDTDGNPVMYSTINDYVIYNSDDEHQSNIIPMYNGQWKLYERTFVAEGLPYETFSLPQITSDSSRDKYVSYPHIDIWVKRRIVSGVMQYEWIRYKPSTGGLLLNGDSQTPFKSTDEIFDLRLNEFKQYEIKFGDGIHGAPLKSGDELYIVYLTSNGPTGEIDVGVLDETTGLTTTILGLTSTILNEFYGTRVSTISPNISELTLTNITSSTSVTVEESVDQIRDSAPQWFKSSGRLITRQDFSHFVKSNFHHSVVDVTVMNNWDYVSSFYAWLYNVGMNDVDNPDGSKYLNNDLDIKYDYTWADACDSNNVYLWMKMKNGILLDNVVNDINNSIRDVKVLTSEPIYLEPLDVKFVPCVHNYENYDIDDWDSDYDNYIEVYIDNNTLLSVETVKTMVNRVIIDYFFEQNQRMGAKISMNDIYTKLSSIRGVKRIRTVYERDDIIKSVDGIQFAYWTNTIVEGSDRTISNGTIQLEQFKFPSLYKKTSIIDRIKVVTDSIYQNTSIEY